ncbi:MAG: conjugative transposon protein TraM [Prevotellaceae bacterium]|nr:conjugative transposon protein TraM [Prevotellaceae bacterium]
MKKRNRNEKPISACIHDGNDYGRTKCPFTFHEPVQANGIVIPRNTLITGTAKIISLNILSIH